MRKIAHGCPVGVTARPVDRVDHLGFKLEFLSDLRNQVRLPRYLRIDARANRTFTFNQKRLTLFLEVINLTGRRNLGWTEGSVKSGTFAATNWTEKLIPWLPSIGILIEF